MQVTIREGHGACHGQVIISGGRWHLIVPHHDAAKAIGIPALRPSGHIQVWWDGNYHTTQIETESPRAWNVEADERVLATLEAEVMERHAKREREYAPVLGQGWPEEVIG